MLESAHEVQGKTLLIIQHGEDPRKNPVSILSIPEARRRPKIAGFTPDRALPDTMTLRSILVGIVDQIELGF
jgi:hypothetical protein